MYIENVKKIFVSIYAIGEKTNVVRRQDLHYIAEYMQVGRWSP